MTADQQQLCAALGEIAEQYRTATKLKSPAEQARLTGTYLDKLERLHDTGWAGALGEGNELPDDLLPPHYLIQRMKILRDLEQKLGEFATMYRSSRTEAQESMAVEEYHNAINEMYRIGHWSGMPDPDSELPDELMPPAYHEQRRRLIAQFRVKQQTSESN